ncbi:hypothetical protein OCHUTO_0342 [Orientia chuto str. Dubai]|uniref:DUF3857 domain-containing protein n=1 Tax=Orientia chuto str. Dubai TaxID=1359168 RepID=A0A0F3MQ81_9RICK|nr:DUF3857 domain-containing protein [Candidatus Orientia mediorientalis]KJV56754.1 hypothetical protein OCHUTO_0342 [Orientia chuto str. Dubai]
MLCRILLLQLIFLIATINSIQARWKCYNDSDLEIIHFDQNIIVNSDGSSEEIIEQQVKILNEAGRKIFTNYMLEYDSVNSQLDLIIAKTIFEGKEYNVDLKSVHDLPLISEKYGFHHKRQILINFTKVEVGTEIHLVYKRKNQTIAPNYYDDIFEFGNGGWHQKGHIKINSALPLYIKINDPYNVLEVKTSSKDKFHSAEITLVKALTTELTNEPENSLLSNQLKTWVSISSTNTWEDVAGKFTDDYYKILNQKLPKLFQVIANKAKKYSSYEDQVNSVTSDLSHVIQYHGDYRSIRYGRFVPWNLAQIAEAQLGDCKDFSISAAAILQNIGYKVQPAFVNRGIRSFETKLWLPCVSHYNHAILRATSEDGKLHWIDPTNFVSMAGGTFPDIANRMSLVLDPENSSYAQIPNINPDHSQLILTTSISRTEKNSAYWKTKLTLLGEQAYLITGAELKNSQQEVKDLIFKWASGTSLEEQDKKRIVLPDLTSRIVKDLTFECEYNKPNSLFQSNLGSVLMLYHTYLSHISGSEPDQIGDLFLGLPRTITHVIEIKDEKIENINIFNFEIDTPWVYIHRFCQCQGNDIKITVKVIFRKSLILNKDLKSDVYKKLKDAIKQNFELTAIVFNDSKKHEIQSN